jgi:hypothetical protein
LNDHVIEYNYTCIHLRFCLSSNTYSVSVGTECKILETGTATMKWKTLDWNMKFEIVYLCEFSSSSNSEIGRQTGLTFSTVFTIPKNTVYTNPKQTTGSFSHDIKS